jgi:hypothetical protein
METKIVCLGGRVVWRDAVDYKSNLSLGRGRSVVLEAR